MTAIYIKKYNSVYKMLLYAIFLFSLITLASCEKFTDPILLALNTSPQILKEKAKTSGRPIDEYVYSIVLRYGLNGSEVNIDEADRFEAGATGEGQIISTGNGAVVNYGNKIDPPTKRIVNWCIAALEGTPPKNVPHPCGSDKDYETFKVLWDGAKGK